MLETPWRVGPVLLLPPEQALAQMDARMARLPADSLSLKWSREALTRWGCAEVAATDLAEAVAATRDILDVLRVLGQLVAQTRTTSFGLPGDVRRAHMEYAQLGENPRVGFRNDGSVLGFGFPERVRDSLTTFRLNELAEMGGRTDLSPGPARAMFAVRLLSQSVLEDRPSMVTLGAVIATESLLGGGGRSFELARRAVYFTCGRPNDLLCGRERPACPLLTSTAVPTLKRLRSAMEVGELEECSEWLDFLARYDARSGVAHGDPTITVAKPDAERDLWWALHRLLPPALSWLLDHPDDPVTDLDNAIAALT